MKDHRRSRDLPNSYRPTAAEVDDLAGHPLGTDFLANGALDAVAATFGVHAFVVDAAREALKGPRPERLEVSTTRIGAAASRR
ncbi:MAG: hypothetical protein ACYSTY_10300 [Planctomycetota bacterium]|jgi:hypothetical protein